MSASALPDNKVDQAFLSSWPRIVFYRFTCFYLTLKLNLKYGVKTIGKDRIPAQSKGSFIVAANHESDDDPPIVATTLLPQRVSFMAKQELFETPSSRRLYRWLGAFSVNREKLEVATIRSAKTVIQSGTWNLGMFPEGTRKHGGQVQGIKKGVAFLAKTTKAPVLTLGITRTGAKRSITVYIGELVEMTPGESTDEFAERIQAAMLEAKRQSDLAAEQ
jgi:1-acyl-sn-glycerol-3-phosphate acyltransferase